jgi:hypothetical protein
MAVRYGKKFIGFLTIEINELDVRMFKKKTNKIVRCGVLDINIPAILPFTFLENIPQSDILLIQEADPFLIPRVGLKNGAAFEYRIDDLPKLVQWIGIVLLEAKRDGARHRSQYQSDGAFVHDRWHGS